MNLIRKLLIGVVLAFMGIYVYHHNQIDYKNVCIVIGWWGIFDLTDFIQKRS